ncbi:Fibroblast growth factor receptor 3 [Trachymyrmex septentrionalis]|uniref:receptor protein-tyrosine kinase n=1 Tax=Trachymyrmex septentrionalis TaxID=34720 RepID=A0A195FZ54_9HYME|nr:Fibroblast growth factor receptor 3 [Trachymyrmex septentrionalis]
MYYQFYDGEEEVEPRVIPKPITKHDCFVVPTVPEISLIFEKPTARDPKNRSIDTTDSFPVIPVRPIISDNTVKVSKPTSPVLHNSDSYATWKEQNYSRETNSTSTTHISPLYKNTYSYDYAVPGTSLQNASIQKLQEQTKINDKQEILQNPSKNERVYVKSVKFTCSDTGDSYHLESQTDLLSSDKRASSSDSLQRAQLNIADRTMRTSNNTIPDALKKPEYFQTPHTGCQPQFHVPTSCNYSNYNIDNNETVKTLLQLVNSQNQQIKNLQLQIDSLVRMQEENFRNKPTCLCSQPLANQVFRYPINCYDPALASSLVQSQNQNIKKNVASQSASVVERQDLENFSENNKLETALLEQQSKKAFMEQKVSIGVMTSFEFTVQNNPFPIESEICEKTEAHRESNNINTRANTVNIHDTTEPVNRYKNTFTRKPGPAAQLENIVEDSESYLSSSQQQSSNFNASSSMKESLKLHQHLSTDLNREEMHKGAYIEKDSNVYERASNARKTSNTSMNVDCSPIGSANCSEALVKQTNDYVTIDGKKCTYKTNINQHSLHNVHLPATDYYHNHRNKEYARSANVRQIKDIGDDSMILSGGDLKILERPPPTPEPSIHVEMQEYVSDDESDKLKHTSKIGWTFYNNVLGQVNEILQNSGVISDEDLNHAKTPCNVEQENDRETRSALNTVKAATLEQLRRLGISLTENEHRESNGNKTLDFDSSFYPRLDHQANMTHATSAVNETNTSMHMKALALKYLSDEQLTDIAWHKQESSSLKHFMLSNMQGTNMSLATMRYLERYQLLPGKNNVQAENTDQAYDKVSSKYDFKPAATNNNPALRQFPFVQTSGTTSKFCYARYARIINLSFQESCRNRCLQPVDEFEPYPRINEKADANVTLHCRGMNTLIIKHHPRGSYIIQQSVSIDTWGPIIVNNGGLSIFSNLTPGTFYRYRLHRITQRGFSLAETSDWFSTYAVDYQPNQVEHISVIKIEEENDNVCELRTEIVFQPVEDQSCNYNILSWSGEHDLINFYLKKSLDFRFSLRHLRYDQNITISIRSTNDDFSKASNATMFTFITPSCLQIHHNLSICAPEKVKGLQIEYIRKRSEKSYDVAVNWNKPFLQPDNYTLQFNSLQFESRLLVVPGDAIKALFSNVDVRLRYEINIVAESMGGVNLPSTISGSIDEASELSYREIIIALSTLVIVMGVFGIIYMQHRNKRKEKNKQTNMEYMHFEGSMDSLKKLLNRDYAVENNDTLLPHNKFLLAPQRLKLKGILGSGAYGIVRLASLQDEFGAITDVAVKMMKDDPTVDDVKNFYREISMMKSAGQHPNIVSLIGYCTLYNKPLLVVEYCSKGDLQTYLRTIWQNIVNAVFECRTHLESNVASFANKNTDQEKCVCNYQNTHTIANRLYDIQRDVTKYIENIITSADLLNFARQVAIGMEFLSSNRIVHRDLAARNVLVRSDRVVKISDFGLSRDIYQENVYRKKGNGKLPLKWMAIEALTHQIYTTYSDVWAFGILLWEIVTLGATPYPDTPTNKILQFLKSGYRMERPPNCSRELYSIMYSCWNIRPQSRPTFTELKQNLDKLLSNYSENKYLSLCDVLYESADKRNESKSINAY